MISYRLMKFAKSICTKPGIPSLLALLIISLPLVTFAQEEESLEEELEEEFELLQLQDEQVVFSASRHQQKKQLSPSSITVITRSQIETAGAFSVVDILRRVPGMEVIVVSPGFTSVNTRLPTTYENHLFLVLIDGREVNNWILGQAFWEALPISADDIERMEIIRGPASAMYGASAFAGVITITTRAVPKESSAVMELEGGSWQRTGAMGRLSSRLGDLGLSLSAGYEYAGDFGIAGELGKELLKARALLEWNASPDLFLRLDTNISDGKMLTPSGIGEIDGGVAIYANTLNIEYQRWRGRLNYSYYETLRDIDAPLKYHELLLARFLREEVGWHDVEGELQFTFPVWWHPLSLIAGLNLRSTWFDCPNCLDPETFSDPLSSRYHQPGVDYNEMRTGAFLHAEVTPLDWLQLSASGRVDYNTDSGFFLSPRLALVAEVAPENYLRLSTSRAFRKLAYTERHFHPAVEFPEESPLQGGDQILFQEFMTRVAGNETLPDETLWAFELGYEFNPVRLNLDFGAIGYLNIYGNVSSVHSKIVAGPQGLPDLRQSSVRYELDGEAAWIAGLEAFIRYSPAQWLTLRGAWTYRYAWLEPGGKREEQTPNQIFSLGAEFIHPSGFLGSLYFSGRTRSLAQCSNPDGLMAPMIIMKLPPQLLFLSRIAYRLDYQWLRLESGIKFMLPVDLASGEFGFYEQAGGLTPEGVRYGCSRLQTSLLFYLNAAF